MANIKWSGIESWKYGLTARWYVSAYYGNDIDVDVVGDYNPTTNLTGHGGPTRPFATISKLQQYANVVANSVVIFDSGYYSYSTTMSKSVQIYGDGDVVFGSVSFQIGNASKLANLKLLQCNFNNTSSGIAIMQDNVLIYCANIGALAVNANNCTFIESSFTSVSVSGGAMRNCTLIKCTGTFPFAGTAISTTHYNNVFVGCENMTLRGISVRQSGTINDYSILIGTIKTNFTVDGKVAGTALTLEDFKTDGNYFVKSFSGVDLFGNASGTGATVAQLQTIFNNYFSPIYLDTWQFVDLSLKPTASEKVRFGGLNGTYIGAKPVGYHYNAAALWANRNTGNTSDIEVDVVTGYLQIAGAAEFGTYESNEINLGANIIVDPMIFMANLVYNSDGTAKQGVANQRIDTNPDALPDNTVNQRVVYDYQLAWSPNNVDALSTLKNFELNRKPTVDGEGDTQLDDAFSQLTAQSITIRRFKIRFVLRKIVIE